MGSVYLRSDLIAYPPDGTPDHPLPGAQVTLAGVSTITTATGSFSLQSSIAATTDFLPLGVSLAGHQPAWYPWRLAEVGQPVSLGLYPEVPVTPRPGFVKGIILMDAGGSMPPWYQAGHAFTTIDRARQEVGANLFAYVDQFMVTTLDIPTNAVTIEPEVWHGQPMGTRQQYEELVARARNRGMQFMMWLSLFPYGQAASTYPMLYATPRSNTAFWDAYFGAWQARVLEKTAIARDLGIEYVTLGHNLGYLSGLEPARWAALIAAIRAQGYAGKLVYFGYANTPVGYSEIEGREQAFLALFDAIGLSIAAGVQPAGAGDIPARTQSRQRMRADLRALFTRTTARLGPLPVSILVYLATPSVHGGASTDEYIEPAIGPGSNSVAPLRTRDYQQQADLYQAAAEVISELPLGNGQVMGLLSWGYAWTNELVSSSWVFDRSANIRGKPAEAVLRWWFARW